MRINLFGAPSSGKSTTAAWLFSELKVAGYNVEQVTEYVKFWTYIPREVKPWDQVYILGKQIHQEATILAGGADHIVSDSPLLIAVFYSFYYNNPMQYDLLNIALRFEMHYPSINIYLEQDDIMEFSDTGRYHGKEESAKIDADMKDYLTMWTNGKFTRLKATDRENIISNVVDALSSHQKT